MNLPFDHFCALRGSTGVALYVSDAVYLNDVASESWLRWRPGLSREKDRFRWQADLILRGEGNALRNLVMPFRNLV